MEKEGKPAIVFRKVIPFVLGAMLIISVLVVSGYFKPVLAFNGQPLSIQAAWATGDCINDADGANDEPGQKDLTKGCIESASREPVHVTWNWDITGLSGNNSADGCALFDTDVNGLADYAICNSWRGDPPVQINNPPDDIYPVLYTCNDTRADRCAGGVPTLFSTDTYCKIVNNGVGPTYADPFLAGDSAPFDTVSECYIALKDVGSPQFPVNLLDVCSYPSPQPNSDPSDCVIRSETKGNLEIHKDVKPDDFTTNWVITVAGPDMGSSFTDILTGDDTTFNKVVTPGTYTISESAGANTSPGYTSSWRCVNSAVDPVQMTSGLGTTIPAFQVTAGSVWDCFFTNEMKVDITVTKTDAVTSWPHIKRIGYPYMYTIQINHVNPIPGVIAFDVSLVDTLDPWLDYKSDEAAYPYTVMINGIPVSPQPECTWVDDATLDGRGGIFSCPNIGDLGSNDEATVTFWVTPVSGAPVRNLIENGTCTQNPSMQGTTPVDICNVVSVTTTSTELSSTNNQDSEPSDIGVPTAVTLGWFDVTKTGTRGITLGWETVSELENLGFNIYRSRTVDGTKKLLNPDLIPTENPGSTFGALYTFRDKTARANRVYYYWLEDVDQSGYTTLHGPVKAKIKR